eukprot:NODE_9_length_47730_cov_0.323718.p16 type:complete len:284 gc:universal NODE_9_length_47730_cov_0.323718:45747-46598(+)
MLYLIGCGLSDVEDISIKALRIIKNSDRVVLEHYTSILKSNFKEMEDFFECKVEIADRQFIEETPDFLEAAKTMEVCLLVVGDPFSATTHADLLLRAHEMKVEVRSIHNASILNAVGSCGISLYHYGQTVSIPLWEDFWRPSSYYEKIAKNLNQSLHTLCLLDIKVKEPTLESLARGKREYLPPRYMNVNTAIEQLLEISSNMEEPILSTETLVVAALRIGTDDQQYVCGSMQLLKGMDHGAPLHSMIIPSCDILHEVEWDLLDIISVDKGYTRTMRSRHHKQ